MSWHLSHRLTTVHRAVSIALFYSVSYAALSSSAQAATIGKTVVTSTQHEPLVASITVTDIKTADFSASLADSSIYQQMGLTPTASMTVRFKPTSSTTGQLLVTTSQPVSKPFADMVLAISDGDQRNVIPETLLMPLSDGLPIKPSNNIITGTKKSNLPVISANNNATPLTVRQGTPPPMLSSPSTQAPAQAGNLATSSSDSANNDFNSSSNSSGNSTLSTGGTDTQLDILNIQVIRQIQPANSVNKSGNNTVNNSVNNSVMAPSPVAVATPKNNAKPIFELIPEDTNGTANSTAKQTASSANNNSTAKYTVQRNDNLWTISQQIAQKNNLDVQTVMKQIQNQNPDAFINQNANQLKANTQLDLADYDVVPSQQSLQAAISAQRQSVQQADKPARKKESKPVAKKSESKTAQAAAQSSKRPERPTTTTQTLPKARFSVLAPGRDGSADGTQTKAAAATGNGLSTDILATLKSTRQSTAAQAERLSKTNNTLGSYTKKLQLQNQKLAELQARLKKLRNQ